MRASARRGLWRSAWVSTTMPRQISETLWPTSRIDGGAPTKRISAAGWKNPVKPVGMWLRVSTSVAISPARPKMMCIDLLSEALQRLQNGQVVGVDAQRLLPRLAREVLVAEPFVQRPLHRQDVLVFGVLPIELGQLDERQFILAGFVEILHPRERQEVARLPGGRLVVARLARRALGPCLPFRVVARGRPLQPLAVGGGLGLAALGAGGRLALLKDLAVGGGQ